MLKLEICCYSIDDAKIAQTAGADRIELCSGRSDGGLTPSYGQLLQAQQLPSIPIHPIIRPRGGDFCYSQSEINSMKNDISLVKELGFPGLVLGVLDTDGSIDLTVMNVLIKLASPLSITFHRAFDVCNNPLLALKKLTDLGIERVLTSGQQANAVDGLTLLTELNQQAEQIIIMPGSGIRINNLPIFIQAGFTEFHSSTSMPTPSLMRYHNPKVSMSQQNQLDEYVNYQVNAEMIAAMKSIFNSSQ